MCIRDRYAGDGTGHPPLRLQLYRKQVVRSSKPGLVLSLKSDIAAPVGADRVSSHPLRRRRGAGATGQNSSPPAGKRPVALSPNTEVRVMSHRRRRISRVLLAVLALTIAVGVFTYARRT